MLHDLLNPGKVPGGAVNIPHEVISLLLTLELIKSLQA